MDKKTGQIIDTSNQLLLLKQVGSAETENMSYTMNINNNGEPVVVNAKTKKAFVLGWADIFELAFAAGLGNSDEGEK